MVFPHTASHAAIGEVVTDDDLLREVHEPKTKMDTVTGQQAAVNVWLAGTPFGASQRHDRAALDAGYRYVVSNAMLQRVITRARQCPGTCSLPPA